MSRYMVLTLPFLFGCFEVAANEQTDYFDSIEKGFWQTDESVINGNESLFTRFCDINGMAFNRFKELVLAPGMLSSREKVAAYLEHNPSRVRSYTDEERTAIFVYLQGYNCILKKYAEEMQDAIEQQECNHFYFEKFKSVVLGLLAGVISGTWQIAVLVSLSCEIMGYFIEWGSDFPFLAEYKVNADWQFLFAQRIKLAEECQLMNLRVI